jgi:hypothetical protein
MVAVAFLAGCSNPDPAPSTTAAVTSPASMHPMPHSTSAMPMEHCAPEAYDGSPPTAGPLVFGVMEPGPMTNCYAFRGPMAAKSGWNTITFLNDGAEPHVMVLFRLEGKTFQDAIAALESGEGGKPEWVVDAGGVSLLGAGRSSSIMQDLQPGTYMMFCWVGGHVMQGMARELRVVEQANDVEPPVPDLTLHLTDFGFTFETEPRAGPRIVAIHNAGAQPHEAPFIRLHGNATIREFAAAIEEGTGPPPGEALGGVNAIPPGATVYAALDFATGRYGLICFVTDPEDGRPHVDKGMALDFSVA